MIAAVSEFIISYGWVTLLSETTAILLCVVMLLFRKSRP